MQGPTFFDNEIIRTQNLEFWRDSVNKNTKDRLVAFTKGYAGILSGFTITSGTNPSGTIEVSTGIGYDANGERVELYSTAYVMPQSGEHILFASHKDASYSSGTSGSYILNTNPITGSGVITSNYDWCEILALDSGTSLPVGPYIPLGLITADGAGNVSGININPAYRWDLRIAGSGSGGGIDINNFSIDGSMMTSGTIDSNAFANPLTYDIYLNSGVGIFPIESGTSDLGTNALPFEQVNAYQGNFHIISGLSPIDLKSSLIQNDGVYLNASGTRKVYIDTIGNGVDFSGITYSRQLQNPNGQSLTFSTDRGLTINNAGYNSGAISITSNSFAPGTLTPAGNISAYSNANISLTAGQDISVSTSTGTTTLNGKNIVITGNSGGGIYLNNVDTTIQKSLTVASGISTIQSFENLLPNSEFRYCASGTSGLPAGWYTYTYGTGDIYYTAGILTSSSDILAADSTAFVKLTGTVAASPANLASLRYNFTPEEGEYYSFSYYYRTSTSGFFIRNRFGNTAHVLSPTVDGSWHLYQHAFSASAANLLCLQIESSIGGSSFDIDIANIKLTKGRGFVNADKNNKGFYYFPYSGSKVSTKHTFTLTPIISNNFRSSNQFCDVSLDFQVRYRNSGQFQAKHEIYLYIDGSQVDYLRSYDWFVNTDISKQHTLGYQGFLSEGNHTVEVKHKWTTGTMSSEAADYFMFGPSQPEARGPRVRINLL